MELREVTQKTEWENFLSRVKPHTFLQSWNWGLFNEQTGHRVWRLGFYENSELVGVALVLKIAARRGSFLFCPHLVTKLDHLQTLTERLKNLAKQEGCAFFRISPLLSPFPKGSTAQPGGISATNPPSPSDHPPFVKEEVFKQLGYRQAPVHMMHPELAWMLDVTPSEDRLLADMRKTTRYSIKKAEKDGVVITTSSNVADIEKFYSVYEKTVKRQQFVAFSKDYIQKEFEVFSTDNQALFFFAQHQGQTVGAALVIFYGNSAFYHHGATTRTFPNLTDAQLLQWHVILEAKKRGLRYYNFWGVVPEEAKSHPWAGLSTFKRGFGGFSETYIHAKDYMVSPKYWLAFVVEKIRKIKRGL